VWWKVFPRWPGRADRAGDAALASGDAAAERSLELIGLEHPRPQHQPPFVPTLGGRPIALPGPEDGADADWEPELFSDEAAAPAVPAVRPHRSRWRRVTLGALVLLVLGMGALYTQRTTLAPRAADFSRNVIGDQNTARIESWYFTVHDRMDRVKYRLFGGTTNPFATGVRVEIVPQAPRRVIIYYPGAAKTAAALIPQSLGPAPLQLPKITELSSNPRPGEGVWTTAGLPHSSPTDMLSAKTFLRPDPSRPWALVGIELFDSRRIRLHMTAGTGDPGGYRGVAGPGVIPKDQFPNLVAAWNGGFKGQHGNFGMYADGTTYVPLRHGLASIAVFKDGTIRIGDWGVDIKWDPNMVAVRQNAVLLVQNGQVSSRTTEGNDTWGYVNVNSSDFITWRSGVGLTKDGNLVYAAGNSLSAATLAKALQAAGAWTAMQLDINTPYVLLGNFFQQPNGTLKGERFMDTMPDSPDRFLHMQERDFMWLTLDESRYH